MPGIRSAGPLNEPETGRTRPLARSRTVTRYARGVSAGRCWSRKSEPVVGREGLGLEVPDEVERRAVRSRPPGRRRRCACVERGSGIAGSHPRGSGSISATASPLSETIRGSSRPATRSDATTSPVEASRVSRSVPSPALELPTSHRPPRLATALCGVEQHGARGHLHEQRGRRRLPRSTELTRAAPRERHGCARTRLEAPTCTLRRRARARTGSPAVGDASPSLPRSHGSGPFEDPTRELPPERRWFRRAHDGGGRRYSKCMPSGTMKRPPQMNPHRSITLDEPRVLVRLGAERVRRHVHVDRDAPGVVREPGGRDRGGCGVRA